MLFSSSASKEYSANYRPDIDGLRALAVLPVLLFHAEFGCPGGFVGVDIFFVISGFLISSIILKELGDGTFSLITFWERRIRRIFPAMMMVVFATLIAGLILYLPKDFESIGTAAVAQMTFQSNVFFRQEIGYFAAGVDTKPLLHTWSLSVEEQFYFFFPLFLIFLTRCRKFPLFMGIICLAVGSFALSVVGSYTDPVATFYLLPTRAWELLIGTLLAETRGRLFASELVREMAGLLGICLVCCSIFFYDHNTRFPGMTAIPPCLGAALIIFSSESKLSFIGKILAFKARSLCRFDFLFALPLALAIAGFFKISGREPARRRTPCHFAYRRHCVGHSFLEVRRDSVPQRVDFT